MTAVALRPRPDSAGTPVIGAGGDGGPLRLVGIAATILLVAAWLSAGAAPLRDAAAGARAPSDFTTDFVPAARLWRAESPAVDVSVGNQAAAQLGAPGYAPIGTPYRAHPPPAVLLVAALVPPGYRAATMIWLGLSLAALAVLAFVSADVLLSTLTPSAPRRRAAATALFVALLFWPPVLHNIEKGQWSLIIAGLLAGAWAVAARGWDRRAGALIALAACFKVMPLLVLAAFLSAPRDRGARGRVLAGALATLAIVAAVSALVVGPAAWADFVAATPLNTRGWQTAPANTLSLWGALARSLVGGPFARPIALASISPGALAAAARIGWLAAAAGLIVVTVRSTRGARPPVTMAPAFAAWSALAVVLAPLSWTHAATWLVLPAVLLAARLRAGAAPAARAGRETKVAALALGAALIVLTIPRATLAARVGPWPASPARGLVLGAHLAAALTIWAVAVRTARVK